MSSRSALRLLFGLILIGMITVTTWASLSQPVWAWGGLVTPPNHAWTIATLADAYAGFLTFYAWVHYKERGYSRPLWFVLIMLLGNMAMSIYVLRELARLGPDDPLSKLLLRTRA